MTMQKYFTQNLNLKNSTTLPGPIQMSFPSSQDEESIL